MKELQSTNVVAFKELSTLKQIPSIMLERYCLSPISSWQERLPRMIVERLVDYFAYPLFVKGIENLDTTQHLIKDGNKIIMFSNHLSWADPSITMAALKRSGFEDIAEMTTIIAGIKLHTDLVRHFLGAAYNVIPVWSPFTEPKNQEEKELRLQMHKKASADIQHTLEIGGILLAYPEATRSRTQTLAIGQPQLINYVTKFENTFVLPIGIYGTEKVLPVGAWLPDGHEVNVVFGEPIDVNDVAEMFKNVRDRQERKQLMMDYFMYHIADCLLPKYHGVYRRQIYAKQAA